MMMKYGINEGKCCRCDRDSATELCVDCMVAEDVPEGGTVLSPIDYIEPVQDLLGYTVVKIYH